MGWVLTYSYSHETITTIKVVNTSITPDVPCALGNPSSSPPTIPSNDQSARYHCSLVYISLELIRTGQDGRRGRVLKGMEALQLLHRSCMHFLSTGLFYSA